MKKLLMILPVVILFCFTFGCQKQGEEAKPEVDIEADVEAIKAMFEPYSSIIAAGDIERWLALYTEDVVFLPPNEAIVKGKDGVRQWGHPYFSQFDMEEAISLEEIKVSGDVAFLLMTTTFQATPKAGGETILENGKAIWILERQTDGSWKGTHTIWNTDNLPPAPKEE